MSDFTRMRDRGVPASSGSVRRRYATAFWIPLERPGERGDAPQPLHVRHAVPPGHDESRGGAVLRQQRLPVHLDGDQHVLAHRFGERQAALVRALLAVLDPAVESLERDLDRVGGHAGLPQERRERRPRPLGGADRFPQPGLAEWAGLEHRASVAGAFQGDGNGDAWARPEVVRGSVAATRSKPSSVRVQSSGSTNGTS